MGAGKSLSRREKISGDENVVFDFASPEFFSRPLRLFPAPTNCPWVSEDGVYTERGSASKIGSTESSNLSGDAFLLWPAVNTDTCTF